jgi:hypothetical protein
VSPLDAPPFPAPPVDTSPKLSLAERIFSRRGITAWALTGVVIGMAAAVIVPSSLSEKLPGTSGNDREPLAAEPSAPAGVVGPDPSVAASPQSERSGSTRSRERSGSAPQSEPSESTPSRERSGSAPRTERSTGAPPGAPDPRPPIGGRGVSGTGNGMIGTLRIDRPMRLHWSSDGGPFSIVSDAWRYRPAGRRGSTVLTPGTYRRLAVRSTGSWTLRLDPAGR